MDKTITPFDKSPHLKEIALQRIDVYSRDPHLKCWDCLNRFNCNTVHASYTSIIPRQIGKRPFRVWKLKTSPIVHLPVVLLKLNNLILWKYTLDCVDKAAESYRIRCEDRSDVRIPNEVVHLGDILSKPCIADGLVRRLLGIVLRGRSNLVLPFFEVSLGSTFEDDFGVRRRE
jgi:hypothetical protein